MQWTTLFPLLEREFQPERCLEQIRGIYENDHWFSFPAFERTAAFCAEAMRKAGLSQVEQLPLAADGKTAYGDWVIPMAWEAKSAVLRTRDGEVLADYRAVPCSLVMYSAPTPPGGIETEVVWADGPAPLEKAALRGKLLFTGRPAKELVPLAVDGGAAGILTDYLPLYKGVRDSRAELSEESRWDNDFIVPRNETGLFAFSLSPRKGDRLRARLSAGTVRLRAEVDTRFYSGVCYTVSGAIAGTEPDLPELLAYGHLYEPGANDNASGCGVLLELARCLTEAIAYGKLPPPRRTIRFLMGYECTGSMGYLCAHPERRQLGAAVADMVGTEAIDRSRLSLWKNPLSNPSFMDAALLAVNRMYQEYAGKPHPWEERPFTVGSDNILGDPILRVPTVAMITEPALSYHSSLDTPERLDPAILKRNGLILGVLLLGLASAGEEDAPFLAGEIRSHRLRQLAAPGLPPLRRALLEAASQRALASLSALRPGVSAGSAPSGPLLPMPPDIRERGGEWIPVRLVKGCLTFQGKPELAASPWKPAWNDRLNLPLFWADGERSLWDIAVRVSAELEECKEGQLLSRFQELSEYFQFLTENGYLTWKDISK